MNIMTKQGQMDNVVTYEHVCDTKADLANIDPMYSTLGSIAIVLEGESGGLEIYITNSEGEWLPLNINASGSGEGGSDIDLSNYLQKTDIAAWAKAAEKPTYTAQEVGALSSSTVIPTVPTDISAFTNDVGYLTAHQDISGKANSADLATVATTGDYDDLTNKPDISNFVTSGYVDTALSSYVTATDAQATYATTSYVDSAVAGATTSVDLSGYAPLTNPQFVNSISMNRKPNTAVGTYSVAVGQNNEASTWSAFAEGENNVASGRRSHAEGENTTASDDQAHAEGNGTTASSLRAHAEGHFTVASGWSAHAEGESTTASGFWSHSEGASTIAESKASHAGGYRTIARGNMSIAIGKNNVPAERYPEWTPNTAYEVGDKVYEINEYGEEIGHQCMVANNDAEYTMGNWIDIRETGDCAIVVGNGADDQHKSNAMYMDWGGNVKLNGDVYVGCTSSSTGGNKVATEAYVNTNNKQADWNETNSNDAGFVKNKPYSVTQSENIIFEDDVSPEYIEEANIYGIIIIGNYDFSNLSSIIVQFDNNESKILPISLDASTRTQYVFGFDNPNGIDYSEGAVGYNTSDSTLQICLPTLFSHVKISQSIIITTVSNNFIYAVNKVIEPLIIESGNVITDNETNKHYYQTNVTMDEVKTAFLQGRKIILNCPTNNNLMNDYDSLVAIMGDILYFTVNQYQIEVNENTGKIMLMISEEVYA